MRRVIHKLFWIWQLDKEEDWINEMARHGYSLEHTGRITYEFEETEADLYKYRSLFLKGSFSGKKNTDYFRFLEEMGIKVVAHCNYPGTCIVYLRGSSSDFPDEIEIYSDIESRIEALKTFRAYMIFVILLLSFLAYINLYSGLNLRNSVFWLNLIMAVLVVALLIAAIVAEVNIFREISKLKKERAIHE